MEAKPEVAVIDIMIPDIRGTCKLQAKGVGDTAHSYSIPLGARREGFYLVELPAMR
jgi:hypothetical protein